MAVLSVTPDGFVLEEVAPGLTVEEVQAATAARLILPATVGTIAA
jgi:3-oxoacid CoA-transferase subunit B